MTRARLVSTTREVRIRRIGVGDLADEIRRIMPRDRWLLHLLREHQTLTTEQIAAITFPTQAKARRRLNLLRERGVLDRFRHAVRPGSQSWRWTLGPVGAAIVAASRGEAIPRPATVRAATNRLAVSPRLHHLLGVNQFFCALTSHARHTRGCELTRWWAESRATKACGALVRPDGHGVWTEHGQQAPFWLEYDTGSEQLSRLVDKLTGYAHLAGTPLHYPVLFWLPSRAREDHLHTLLSRANATRSVTVATAVTDNETQASPAGTVWRVAEGAPQARLIDIPKAGGHPWDE